MWRESVPRELKATMAAAGQPASRGIELDWVQLVDTRPHPPATVEMHQCLC